jgi:hypothetical protein
MTLIDTTVEIGYLGKNKLFLKSYIGEGTLSDERKYTLSQTNSGLIMNVVNNGDDFEIFVLSFEEISKIFDKAIMEFKK